MLSRHNLDYLETRLSAKPDKAAEEFSSHSFSALFSEVRVDADSCAVRLELLVGVYGAGRIVNLKMARNQIMGDIIMGLGMALMEESELDARFGRYVNTNLSDYLVPSHADVKGIEVHFLEEKDEKVNPLGVKGIGELGLVSVAAAIANAVYHATGKRVRNLPITLDKLL